MNGITFKCNVSVYLILGTVHGYTIDANDLTELYEKRDLIVKENEKLAERITFGNVIITSKSTLKKTSKQYKLIEGDYTNAYLTHINKKS